MAYNITNSRGNIITISDGATNTTDTSLTLIGKNTTGYGEALNTNFYKLLENFANVSQPNNPISGQLWFDTTNNTLKVYGNSAVSWKNIGTVTSGTTTPSNPTIGDTFFDESIGALYVQDGVSTDLAGGWKLIGPQTSETFGIETGADTSGGKLITKLIAGSEVTAVLSYNNGTVISTDTNVNARFGTMYDGLNVFGSLTLSGNGTVNGTYFTGTAENANKLGNITATTYVTAGSGNVTVLTGETNLGGNLTITGNITPTANVTYDLGSASLRFRDIYAETFSGESLTARYADLAERFSADQPYSAGVVVRIGGSAEVTQENQELSTEVLGVVSTNPAFLMNDGTAEEQPFSDLSGSLNPPIVIGGRAPVKVIGTVAKGQRLVSAGNGMARGALAAEANSFNVIGRALEDKTTSDESMVMAIIKINT